MRIPQSIQEIADVIGLERAFYLVGRLPRRKGNRVMLYVPKKLKANHRLVGILGLEDARKMVQAFGGENLYPANCAYLVWDARKSEARRLRESNFSVRMISVTLGVSERKVYAYLAPEHLSEEIRLHSV
jgi:hypothetical protein